MLNTLSVESFAIPGDAMFVLNAHYAAPSSRQDAGWCYDPFLLSIPFINTCRLSSSIPHTSSTGVGCTSRGHPVRGWNWGAQQMVDVIPEATLHEQKSGLKKVL
jgi:hypothetical protein